MPTKDENLLKEMGFKIEKDAPPPVQRGRQGGTKWDNIIDALASTPGQWVSKEGVSSSMASNLRKRAKNGLTPPIEVRMVGVEQKTGKGTLWLKVLTAEEAEEQARVEGAKAKSGL